jgi:hypothetical protein
VYLTLKGQNLLYLDLGIPSTGEQVPVLLGGGEALTKWLIAKMSLYLPKYLPLLS